MIIDINKLQDDIRQIGSLSDGEAFFEGFLNAFNFPRTTIDRLKASGSYHINEGVKIGQKIYYLFSQGSNLYSDLNILKKNNLTNLRTRFIILANEIEILVLDLNTNETLLSKKTNLYIHTDFFFPLIGIEKPVVEENIAVNIKVSEKFAQLYNECIENNQDISRPFINCLFCQILFCCVIDSMGLLLKKGNQLFTFSKKYTDESGCDFSCFLHYLFTAIHQSERHKLPLHFSKVNYIDSRLFPDDLSNISFTRSMRNLVLEIMSFNWSCVDPEILGALIQSIFTSDDNNISGNYTPTSNILKVIGPLFLDNLYSEFENHKSDKEFCRSMISRLMNICIFDASCGCGNFLLISYKELNNLLSKIASTIGVNSPPIIPTKNFFGIEANLFSCIIARMGLLFTILQAKGFSFQTLQNEIDILFNNNIICGNPTRIAWDSVCSGEAETYIIGNPSYRGARRRNNEQNADMDYVFAGYKDYKNLDYAACWFLLASKFIHLHGGSFAFVTTNSLTQGEQVNLLWPKLFEQDVHIRFGHAAFKWRNDARNTTAVTVVIIGVVTNEDQRKCELYTSTRVTEAFQISPYLLPGTIFVQKRREPISALPKMVKGNMPYGPYLLMDTQTKNDLLKQNSSISLYLKKIVGSREFIQGIERWCLWIKEDEANEALKIPQIKERVDAQYKIRINNSDCNARRLAARPYQFREMRETTKQSLVIPSVSSENRLYIPVGFIDNKVIVSNLAFVIYDCDPWIFGVISSKMHNLWIRAVCGGLETRLRYSNELGYNTFPFPVINESQKRQIRICVNKIIEAREEVFDKTYAQMYSQNGMTQNLKFAHSMLDFQIEKCYRDEPFINDDERLDCLFELYGRIRGHYGKHN